MRAKNPNCPKCGVIRSTDNTSTVWTEDGSLKLLYICKECATKYVRDKRYRVMSDKQILAVYEKHLNCIEMLVVVLKERDISKEVTFPTYLEQS
jgi:hypothetical protein